MVGSEPEHHGRPMYHEEREGRDMRRWLCTEPGCPAVLSDDTLSLIAEATWAREHGMIHPQEARPPW